MFAPYTTPDRRVMFMPPHTPGERLKQLRERLKLSYRQAQKRAETVSYSTLRNLENRAGNWEAVELGTVRALARAYGIPLDQLVAFAFMSDDAPDLADEVLKKVEHLEVHPDWVAFPVYGPASAGDIGAATPGEDDVAYIPREHLTRRGSSVDNIRVFIINGSCMVSDEVRRIEKNYAPGDYIAVDTQRPALPGDVVVAWWDEQHAMLIKRLLVDRENVVLRPLSSQHQSVILPNAADLHVVGPVVWRGG